MAALIWGLDDFPRVLPAVIIPGGFLGAFGLLVSRVGLTLSYCAYLHMFPPPDEEP